jgi:hypothetical protein
VDVGRFDIENILTASCRETTSLIPSKLILSISIDSKGAKANLFGEEGHYVAFVKKAQLSVFGLLVVGVSKNTAVQQRAVDVGNHTSDVASAVWLLVAWV